MSWNVARRVHERSAHRLRLYYRPVCSRVMTSSRKVLSIKVFAASVARTGEACLCEVAAVAARRGSENDAPAAERVRGVEYRFRVCPCSHYPHIKGGRGAAGVRESAPRTRWLEASFISLARPCHLLSLRASVFHDFQTRIK